MLKMNHTKWHNIWIKLCNVFHARRNYCNSSHKLGCCALSLIIHHCDVQLDWQGMSNAHPYNPPHFNSNVKTGAGEKFTIKEIISSLVLMVCSFDWINVNLDICLSLANCIVYRNLSIVFVISFMNTAKMQMMIQCIIG